MTLECLVSNPLRKQMFHQDYIDLRSFVIEGRNMSTIKDEEELCQDLKNHSIIKMIIRLRKSI